MIHAKEIWNIIKNNIQKGTWVSLEDIYKIVENNWKLDADDFKWQSPTSDVPRWKRNVRNVLQYRKIISDILWNGEAKYKLN